MIKPLGNTNTPKTEVEKLTSKENEEMKHFLNIGVGLGLGVGFYASQVVAIQGTGLGFAPIIESGAALIASPVLGAIAGTIALWAIAVGVAKGFEYLTENNEERTNLTKLGLIASEVGESYQDSFVLKNKDSIVSKINNIQENQIGALSNSKKKNNLNYIVKGKLSAHEQFMIHM
ncbi:hypothetical protein GW796_06540 [archaeon]|nr:hypothetical protein [archaeon]